MADTSDGIEASARPLPRYDGSFGIGVVQLPTNAEGQDAFLDAHWLRTLVEGMPQLVWRSCDLGDWTWSGPQWQVFTGQSQEESKGRGWMEAIHPDDRPATIKAWAEARSHGMLDTEFRVRKAADGSYVWHHSRSLPVLDKNGKVVEWLGTTTDIQDLKALQEQQAALLNDLEAEIEERKRADEQLLYTAFHDDLTKLHNRAYFMGRCRRALAEFDATSGKRTALLTLDLDRFKLINDSLGHGSGDVVLTVMAKRLRGCLREHDTVARIGGDEFAFLIENMDEAGVLILADGILAEVGRPVRFGRRQVPCSGSLGVAWMTTQHRAEDLLRDADLAMYEAKRAGLGHYQVFTEAMRDGHLEALDLRTDLAAAIRNGEFEIHYQPICDAATATITGVEALIRWRHPSRGLLTPGVFIAAAEYQGMMRHIGHFALTEGVRQLQFWRARFPALALVLHVNLSAVELKDPDLVRQVAATLASAGIESQALQLEVTESVFLDQPEQTAELLAQLRRLGVRIALDDFGTGYSSLSYIEQYELDTIKIDQGFVARMLTHPRTRAVVTAIVQLGEAIGLEVVAEGVETQEQLHTLVAAGCGSVQGFLLGRPMSADRVTAMLDQQLAKQ